MIDVLEKINVNADWLSEKKLTDKTLMEQPLTGQVGTDFSVGRSGQNSFSVSADARIKISLFNDALDRDPHGILTHPVADENEEEGGAKNWVDFRADKEAFLKYNLSVTAGAEGSFSGEGTGISWDGFKHMDTLFYKKHSRETPFTTALMKDLKSFKTPLHWESVNKLETGDVLAWSCEGRLEASANVSWSNVLQHSLPLIADAIPGNTSLDIQLGPQFAAEFELELSGSFLYGLKKTEGDRIHLLVSKQSVSSSGATLSYGMNIRFKDSEKAGEQLEVLADRIVSSLLGDEIARIEEWVGKLEKGEEVARDISWIDRLLHLLGVDSVEEYRGQLKERYGQWRTSIIEKLKEVSSAYVEMGMTYQYRRIKTGEELLSVDMPIDRLKPLHPELLRFRLSNMVEAIRADGGREMNLHNYFKMKTLRIERSFGFSMGIFGREFMASGNKRMSEVSKEYNISGQCRLNRTDIRGYRSVLFGEKLDCWVEFAADMDGFSEGAEVKLKELEFSMALGVIQEMGRVKKKHHLKALLDPALAWGILFPDDVHELAEKYLPDAKESGASLSLQLKIPSDLFHPLMHQLGQSGLNEKARLLAAEGLASVTPYWEHFPERYQFELRQRLYRPIWLHFLREGGLSTFDMSNIVSGHLRKEYPEGKLHRIKGQNQRDMMVSVAEIVRVHPHFYRDFLAFIGGLQKLHGGIIRSATYDSKYQKAYGQLKHFFAHPFYIRCLGAFMLGLSNAQAPGLAKIEKTGMLIIGKGEDAMDIVFSGGN